MNVWYTHDWRHVDYILYYLCSSIHSLNLILQISRRNCNRTAAAHSNLSHFLTSLHAGTSLESRGIRQKGSLMHAYTTCQR